MEIINIIETIDGVVTSCESFVINEKTKNNNIKQAEELFIAKIKELHTTISQDEINECLEAGLFESFDYLEDGDFETTNYIVCLTWSTIMI